MLKLCSNKRLCETICLRFKFVLCVRSKPDLLRLVALIGVYCLLLLWTQEEPVQQREQVFCYGVFLITYVSYARANHSV